MTRELYRARRPCWSSTTARRLLQSNAILRYLAEGTALLPEPDLAGVQVAQLLFFEREYVMNGIGSARFPILTGRQPELVPAAATACGRRSNGSTRITRHGRFSSETRARSPMWRPSRTRMSLRSPTSIFANVPRRMHGSSTSCDCGASWMISSMCPANGRELGRPVTELARGRASAVYDLGDGRVLRLGGAPAREAAIMERVREHGFPVPEVLEVRADGLVLRRIDGPTMLETLRRRPWGLPRQMRVLAELHERLHRIPADATRSAVVHRDLHPANVLLTPAGPVVVDWTNAGAGDPRVDTALTYLILSTSGGAFGRLAGHLFARHANVAAGLPAAAEYRLRDPNIFESERLAVERLARRKGGAGIGCVTLAAAEGRGGDA